MSRTRLLFATAFALWEAYWAYVFFSAPIPDEKMHTVLALAMGVYLPLIIGIPVAGYLAYKSL